MQYERNSAHWMPDLVRLSDGFYKGKLNPRCVNYKRINFSVINTLCDEMVDVVKNEMCPKGIVKIDCLLDRHKIIAIHILAFLKNKLFADGSDPRSGNTVDTFANEYYCLMVFKVILEAWHENDGKVCAVVIPSEYEQCLLKIFYKYGKSPLLNVRDTTFIYALASIAYFVERCFLVTS